MSTRSVFNAPGATPLTVSVVGVGGLSNDIRYSPLVGELIWDCVTVADAIPGAIADAATTEAMTAIRSLSIERSL
jgi:hypothetical protein